VVVKLTPVLDILLSPFTLLAAFWFLIIRKTGVERTPLSRQIFYGVGVFPIRDHYYEPLFNSKYIKKDRKRTLPGIDLNVDEQIRLLAQFSYGAELNAIPIEKPDNLRYYYKNPSYFEGDGEYLYSIIRLKKPKRIVEIGSGFSTLMMMEAIRANKTQDPNYDCEVTCIEPYEMPWLEQLGVNVIRKQAQDISLDEFTKLGAGDILFIDSSHMIRPDGDVLFEYLELLPNLRPGVLIHIHDIYTPNDYPFSNYEKFIVFINEQYLVEAFLSMNGSFKIIGTVSYLRRNYFKELSAAFPLIARFNDREPRSMWIEKIG